MHVEYFIQFQLQSLIVHFFIVLLLVENCSENVITFLNMAFCLNPKCILDYFA